MHIERILSTKFIRVMSAKMGTNIGRMTLNLKPNKGTCSIGPITAEKAELELEINNKKLYPRGMTRRHEYAALKRRLLESV